MMRRLKGALGVLRRYPTVGISLLLILALIAVSVYTMVTIPLDEAVDRWNAHENTWWDIPRAVPPAWTNLFRAENLPETILVSTSTAEDSIAQIADSVWTSETVISFDYEFTTFPSEIAFYYSLSYVAKKPQLTLTWLRPDGEEIQLYFGAPRRGRTRLRIDPEEVLGEAEPSEADGRVKALPGEYTLRIDAMLFEEGGLDLDGDLVLFGGVYGLAGTDFSRRDLTLGLLWGTPIALMLGFIAATGTTLLGFMFAAIGAWLGGWVDATIQRITEINMMIPFLPVILMVGWFYSESIWVILGFIVGFSIFSGRLKTYRAMFLQLVNAPYIEAARAYGAGSTRIIFRYMIPHVFPALLPHIILGIPLFVFLEASLAFLGIADPQLLTWGKILSEAREALYMGYYHWVLGPAFLLLLTGLSFSMLGYSLDRVFNPRLRDV